MVGPSRGVHPRKGGKSADAWDTLCRLKACSEVDGGKRSAATGSRLCGTGFPAGQRHQESSFWDRHLCDPARSRPDRSPEERHQCCTVHLFVAHKRHHLLNDAPPTGAWHWWLAHRRRVRGWPISFSRSEWQRECGGGHLNLGEPSALSQLRSGVILPSCS
jgi:hypothetical protein